MHYEIPLLWTFVPDSYENGAIIIEIPFPLSLVFDSSYEIHIFLHEILHTLKHVLYLFWKG